MFNRNSLRETLPLAFTLMITLLVVFSLGPAQPSTALPPRLFDSPLILPSLAFESPISTPTPLPTPIPGPSEAARKALAYIAQREGIPAEALVVVTDHPTKYPALDRSFQAVTLLDTRPEGQFYKLLVDLVDGRFEEDVSALLAAEAEAHQAKYGKLEQALYERLETLRDDETVPVAIWVAAGPGQTLAEQQQAAFAQLAAKYPEARTAMERSGKPMDVEDRELARRIEAEYIALMEAQTETRVRPVVAELERQGFNVTTYAGLPSFTATLPKRVILELSKREDVSAIYLIEAQEQPQLDSAVPTSLAPIVWGRGYDGSGVTIAILEHGNIDPNNSFLHHASNSREADNGVQDHTTRIASDAASFHGTYRGAAPDATVLSAGENGQQADVVAALQWALDQGARVVNYSARFEEDNNVNWTDRAFDYWARHRFRAIIVAAGNSGGSIGSPGKGWNIITVGATDDQNTSQWSDDQMWPDSAYINPISPHGDREKPEVVAVGDSVTALGIGDVPRTRSGTSHAAPQVAGLAALLIDRDLNLRLWSEAARAIIMASATHNIEGPRNIPPGQELRDGAGAINAALADTVAQVRNISDTEPCQASCWWGFSISNTNFPVGSYLHRYFNAGRGDLIRVAISWWAHADTPGNNYSFDRLDTDLQLGVLDPDWQWAPGAYSASWDNNYELVEFIAPKTGVYSIAVYKTRADEPSNYLGIALLRIPLPYRVYLPLVMKNYP